MIPRSSFIRPWCFVRWRPPLQPTLCLDTGLAKSLTAWFVAQRASRQQRWSGHGVATWCYMYFHLPHQKQQRISESKKPMGPTEMKSSEGQRRWISSDLLDLLATRPPQSFISFYDYTANATAGPSLLWLLQPRSKFTRHENHERVNFG